MIVAALDPLIGVVIAAVIGPLGAYLVAARKLSGKVATSDAKELWDESRSIREWSKARIDALELQIAEMRGEQRGLLGRVSTVEGQNRQLGDENRDLTEQIIELNATITELRAEIVALTTELKASHKRVEQLEEEATDGQV